MSRAEALKVLGLEEGALEEQIRCDQIAGNTNVNLNAHRRHRTR